MNSVPPAHRAQRLAFKALARMRGEAITYYVNADTPIAIDKAVLSRPKQHADQVGRVVIQANLWDWQISPDDLDIEIKRGHWIIRKRDGARFDLKPHSSNDEKVWRWCDGSEAFRRVHVHEA